jgi:hypothetical protein
MHKKYSLYPIVDYKVTNPNNLCYYYRVLLVIYLKLDKFHKEAIYLVDG